MMYDVTYYTSPITYHTFMTTFSAAIKANWWRPRARLAGAEAGPLSLDRRRIFILPSRSGLFFMLVLLIMLLGSINYNNSMGYAFSFLLGSMTMVSALHTQRNLLGLRIEVGKVTPVFAGETAQFQLWLDNRGRAARYALIWQSQLFSFFSKAENVTSFSPLALSEMSEVNSRPCQVKLSSRDLPFSIDIPADQRVSITIPVPTTQRGRLPLGRVTVSSAFPLGLFQAWAYVHLDVATLVYPQPVGHKTLPRGKQSENTGEGSPCEGGGEDFIGYRNYVPGDSPRHVDWKAVARGQEWLIKQFGGMNVASIWLTWEDVSTLNQLEVALSQLCLWILVAESQGALYGLKIPGCILEPNTGELHRERCLAALALFPNE
jgi:uncharacterized protein (DUF58 family)